MFGVRYRTVSYDDGRTGGGEFSLRSPGVPRQSNCPAGISTRDIHSNT